MPQSDASPSSRRRPEQMGGRPVLDVDSIVTAALDEVEEVGLAALSIAAVARRLEVTPRAIYHYVDDRSALARRAVGRWMQLVPTLTASDAPREALRSFIVASARHFVRYRFVQDIALADGFEYGEDFYAMQEARLGALVAWGARPDEALLLFQEIARFVDGAARHYPEAFVDGAAPVWHGMGQSVAELAAAGAPERYPVSADAGEVSSAQQVAYGIELFLDGLCTRLPALRAQQPDAQKGVGGISLT